MRYAYLIRSNGERGSRGGVTSGYSGGNEYELEIGQNQNASPELLALCVHADEIMEFLEKCDSPIGGMILNGIIKETKELEQKLRGDQKSLDEYLDSVREAEIKVEKAKRWIKTPLPTVGADHLNLELTPDEPRLYVQAMFELIYLAFKTDSTRVATYQIGRENGVGKSDHLARAVGFSLAHQLSHETKNPDGWKNFGIYCRFLNEEYGRFAMKLKQTPEPAGEGSMLDNTLLLFGSASSAFHLSRNYPLILTGGKNMGFKHGQYLNLVGANAQAGAWDGRTEPWQKKATHVDKPLSNLFVTMLQGLGVSTESFADSDGTVAEIL